MRQKKKLLMAALLAVAVSTQGFAQPEALSEDELEEVSAQGLQIVENHNATFDNHGPINSQNNNLDSVQVNDGAMSGAITGYGAVLANSAVNSTANYLYDSLNGGNGNQDNGNQDNGEEQVKTFSNYFEQTNEQTAKNHVNFADPSRDGIHKSAEAANINKESQRVGTGVEVSYKLKIKSQNNNNNSVQITGAGQSEASGKVLINAAASAVNAGENLFYAGSVSDTEGLQYNKQEAYNFKNTAEVDMGTALAHNSEIEKGSKTQIVSNAGLALSHPETRLNKKVKIVKQNNNNNSVQLSNQAEKKASYVTLKNIAKSAANNGVNAVYLPDGMKNSSLSQTNEQKAENHLNVAKVRGVEDLKLYVADAIAENENKQGQLVDNASHKGNYNGFAKIRKQNNNNNSVQLNNRAQRSAKGVIIENAAASAVNKGVNLLGITEVVDSKIKQSNNQKAFNFDNIAESPIYAYAGNTETDEAQKVINMAVKIGKQNNNNNSVQLNNNAQRRVKGLIVENLANSAQNTGVNVLSGSDLLTVKIPPSDSGGFTGYIEQYNDQMASNHNNTATLSTKGETAIAENYNKERQVVETYNRRASQHLKINNQNNNNNSVQLNGNSQYKAKAGVISDSSLSANNIGLNIMGVGDIVNSEITQKNHQVAKNFNNTADNAYSPYAGNHEDGATQDINNMNEFTDIINMNNNNNSVQLNDEAERYAKALLISNIANSATNSAINGLKTGNITDSYDSVFQTNEQEALNHINTTDGFEAISENTNKETQVIRNFTVDDPESLAYIENQNNNNNSVQLTGNAQSNTKTAIMENISLSASNTALNLLSTGDVNVPIGEPDPALYGNITGSLIEQFNNQVAKNFNNEATGEYALALNGEFTDDEFYRTEEPEAGQMIENIHGNIAEDGVQNNNNNSVQLNDGAQSEAAGIIISNIANSATNIAVNMMTTGDITGTDITQENKQEAYNHMNTATGDMYAFAGNLNKQKQYIYNCNCTAIDGEQNNNMNSVQLNGNAQANLQTLVLLNSANSAANIGVNVLHAGTVSGSSIVQKNTATAVNFSNTATGGVEATAINAENYTYPPLMW
ncbi:hypothetical protein PERMA_1034 [Persephonella marina EX-H1]|uniref:Uncharacterized protein n=1 Tax=Persephonella marina (strain DSM 14350 / EX-H1) TaxID=123214 RepID=C0QQ74_PERMH|nr:hypothetical protein [Persephonella marina]ACO03661.1 hypothetical protein PERMA_1034 [Persephonella marina EX-H1]